MDTSRPRARDIGLRLGRLEPGPLNGITDVPGVAVGHTSLVAGLDVRTGVTAIVTHPGDPFDEKTVAATFVLNGFGKTCGLAQVAELGLLETPILLTNTLCVPRVADALLDWTLMRHPEMTSVNPLVGECNDAFLNDIGARPVRSEHVFQAIAAAGSGPVQEGSVGAGVGMSCYGWKGGIGTASRHVEVSGVGFQLGALVLANFGRPEELVIDGVRVGELLLETHAGTQHVPRASGAECAREHREVIERALRVHPEGCPAHQSVRTPGGPATCAWAHRSDTRHRSGRVVTRSVTNMWPPELDVSQRYGDAPVPSRT